jgi:hypothetical protein
MNVLRSAVLAATMVLLAPISLAGAADAVMNPYDGWAQPGPPPVERFVKPLGLSASQQERLKPIFVAAQAKAAADNNPDPANTPTPEASRSLTAVREADLRTRLAAVLSAEQLATYDTLTEASSANAARPHSHPTHGHSDMNSAKPADETVEETGED